jgi:hypothetical protein
MAGYTLEISSSTVMYASIPSTDVRRRPQYLYDLDLAEFYITPMSNPDGYEWTLQHPKFDKWRKTGEATGTGQVWI